MKPDNPDFYVGYQPKMPVRLGRRIKTITIGLVGAGALLAGLLLAGQSPFDASTFEFLNQKHFDGIYASYPYPSLLVEQDGQVTRYLLVAPGKIGFQVDSTETGGLPDGAVISMDGTLIYRDEGQMIEVVPESLRMDAAATAGSQVPPPEWLELGAVTLYGEIVDTKCFLGVMNPGAGKVHRECATLCIRGGVPPGFLVRDSEDRSAVLMLVGSDGRALNNEVLDFVAEPLQIHGELSKSLSGTLVLRAEPSDFVRYTEVRQ